MRKRKAETQQGVDIAELMAWEEHCERHGRTFGNAIAYARDCMLQRLSVHAKRQVRELIDLLEEARGPLLPPILGLVRLRPDDPYERLFNYRKRCIRVGIWTTAALAVYDDDREALKNFAAFVLNSRDAWPSLSRALIESRLYGWKDWRDAKDPQSWIAKVARHIAREEAMPTDAPGPGKNDALGALRKTVPYDDIESDDGVQLESHVTRSQSFEGYCDEARKRGDLELLAYIEGLKDAASRGIWDARKAHRETRKQMGWNKFEASKIRARFLRLQAQAGKYEYVVRGGVSAANQTVFFEPLYDGSKGREHGDWTHKRPYPPSNLFKTNQK